MKRSVIAVSLVLGAILTAPCSSTAHAEVAPVEVGQVYKVYFDNVTPSFKILELGKGGLVKVQAVDNGARGSGVENGSTWWLNLNHALMVQAIK